MREQEILIEVISLQKSVGSMCRKWNNYTFQYADIDKEELLLKMKKAMKNIVFQSPKPWPRSWEDKS